MGSAKYYLSYCLLWICSIVGGHSSPKNIGTFKQWHSYNATQYNKQVYYILSAPEKKEGDYKKRGATYIIVAHRPGISSLGVVSIEAGFRYKLKSKIKITIDNKHHFNLLPHDETAWCANPATDKQLISTMRQGRKMIIESFSSRGTKVTDTYSLMGFGAAYKLISDKAAQRKKAK